MTSAVVALPDVTLVAIDCVAHQLTKCAIADSLTQIKPREVIVWTNDVWQTLPGSAYAVGCRGLFARCESLRDVASLLWYEAPRELTTSHMLLIQYDGWVLDATKWNAKFLEFDYIGAPWHWHHNRRVGNGGFSLRSKRLMTFLRDHMDDFPLTQRYEDDLLCRVYRPALELHGFRWADESTAREFSFERSQYATPTFGFHGLFNLPNVLTAEKLEERKSLANDYVRRKIEWREIESTRTE